MRRAKQSKAKKGRRTSSSAFNFPLRIFNGAFLGDFRGFRFAFSHVEKRGASKRSVVEVWCMWSGLEKTYLGMGCEEVVSARLGIFDFLMEG